MMLNPLDHEVSMHDTKQNNSKHKRQYASGPTKAAIRAKRKAERRRKKNARK